MIHVLNFKDEIIDFISQNDEHIIQANHKRNINDRSETFDFTILSKRTEHLKERNRIIIQDSNKQYREFIIEHISSDIDGYTTIESSASYLQDIATAKPLPPMKLEKMTTMQALKEVLKDTGWEASDETEYGGTRTTSWTSYNTKYEVLLQLCTTYSMMLDFYIELDSNTVKHRYVTLKKRNALFKGKEIVYGKDLLGLKRTVDLSSIKTALLCVGPEDDKGQRIVLEVHDDEAQERFGLPKRYIWDVYEPESDDDKMTEARLRTLGTTELNKRKVEIISYEVSSLDIKDSQPHEVVYLGDKVRIKNRDFTPPLYVEAEVVGEEYDLIAKESNYMFGQYKEYREEDLRKAFEKRLSDIRTKLNDSISNVNTIVQETIDNELQYFEKKIIKSDTPPENAVNDVFWLDTSNPNVPILKRYWEGQWIKASVDNAEDIGGITREKALFSELSNTFINLTIQHSKLLNEMHEVMNSEYLVDEDIKVSLNSNLDKTVTVFNNIKTNLESMNEDTATIGKLVDTQALFLKYREQLQALYKVVEQAKLSIDARFKLLQSQYTEEKWNDVLDQLVSIADGLERDENGRVTGKIDTTEQINKVLQDVKEDYLKDTVQRTEYTTDKEGIVNKIDETKSEVLKESNQIAQSVSKKVYDNESKTLNQTLSQYINDTSTGHQFTYDENGNISSFVVGNGGIKIDGDKVNITANKEFTTMVNAVSNKADETNIINKINLSREGLDINVNNIGIRGGDSTNYLTIKNQEILSRGIFTRTWGGVTDTPTATVGIKDGYILSRNQKTGYSLYMTEKGLSTMMSGGVGSEQAGALEFHYDLMNDSSRGVRLSSTYGVVFLHSENSRIYTRSRYTTNIESWESSIYLRPQVNSRTGVNEFSFYIKDNDSAGATDGTILFGEISDEKGLAGSGIRFKKGAIRGQTEPIVYATDNQGSVGTGSFYADNLYGNLKAKTTNQYALVASDGEFRVTDKNGVSGSTVNYRDIRIGGLITYNGFMNHSGANVYFGVGSKELRITNNNHYNGGDTTYRAISAADFIKASKAEFKRDIEEWNYDALTVLMEELQLYSYKYKNDDRGIIHHGAVIGDGYNMPSEFRMGDGINTNEMLSWSLRAIQQLGQKIKILEDKLNEQKS